MLIQFLTTFLTHTWEFSTPASHYRKYTVHIIELYLISTDSNNSKLKAHYKSYCLILSKVIKAAKQLYFNSKISKSNNKIKITWDIIKTNTCKNHPNKGPQLINRGGK
jgi:hypothetical protein